MFEMLLRGVNLLDSRLCRTEK